MPIRHPILDLSIDELLLDQENPRLGTMSSQSEALAGIVRLNTGHFRTMMGSIRDVGLDPGDSLYVIRPDNGADYTVLEGNRRLSALKVLNNPDLLAGTDLSDSVRRSLLGEVEGFDRSEVEPIRCVLFNSRDEANDWIRRRHTGAANGEGRIDWKPLDSQRFIHDFTTIDVIEFVERNAAYTKEKADSVRAVLRGRKSTNLTRLLESRACRDHLGITVKETPARTTPTLGVDPTWALEVLKRFVDDILSGDVNSRRLNTASDITDYFTSLPPELQRGPSTQCPPQPFRRVTLPSQPKPPPAKSPPLTKPAPPGRQTLAPKNHPFDVTSSTKLSRLVREAATLNATKYPLASAGLLRAIIELAVHDYLDRKQLQFKFDDSLTKKADAVLMHMSSTGTPSQHLRPFRSRLLAKQSHCSIQSLNSYIHSPYAMPRGEELRSGWEALLPLLIATYGSP